MGVSDEAMKPMNVPEDIKRAAIKEVRPQINKISRKMMGELAQKLSAFEGKPNSEPVRAAIKAQMEGYLQALRERGFISDEPIAVTIVGENGVTGICLNPNPFEDC